MIQYILNQETFDRIYSDCVDDVNGDEILSPSRKTSVKQELYRVMADNDTLITRWSALLVSQAFRLYVGEMESTDGVSAWVEEATFKDIVNVALADLQAAYDGMPGDSEWSLSEEEYRAEKARLCRLIAFEDATVEMNAYDVSIDDDCLRTAYGLDHVSLSRKRDIVTVSQVVVHETGRGNGTRFMADLCREADTRRWILALTPDTAYGAGSIGRLKKFYRRFGFCDNKGRHADFRISESMIRVPSKQIK